MGSACVLDGEKAEEQIDTDAELYDKIYRRSTSNQSVFEGAVDE